MILEIANHVLLYVISSVPQLQSSTHDHCRYFLNTHVGLANKFLNLTSTREERIVTLNFLTAIVANSVTLAKEVLLHVNFNPANLQLLTKYGLKESGVRNAFVRFLVAFLVDGHYPTISMLLDKQGMLSSITSGLRFDSSEDACMVMAAFKGCVLENPLVMKTQKMKLFNTQVVKDIVNLYNWKGSGALKKGSGFKVSVQLFHCQHLAKLNKMCVIQIEILFYRKNRETRGLKSRSQCSRSRSCAAWSLVFCPTRLRSAVL